MRQIRFSTLLRAAFLVAALLTTPGCKTMTADATVCNVIKDGSFAVATFGCMKISDLPARDLCTKAALAGSLLAQQACLARLAKEGLSPPETGDPLAPEDLEVHRDAQAIIDEWRALESPSQQAPPGAQTR